VLAEDAGGYHGCRGRRQRGEKGQQGAASWLSPAPPASCGVHGPGGRRARARRGWRERRGRAADSAAATVLWSCSPRPAGVRAPPPCPALRRPPCALTGPSCQGAALVWRRGCGSTGWAHEQAAAPAAPARVLLRPTGRALPSAACGPPRRTLAARTCSSTRSPMGSSSGISSAWASARHIGRHTRAHQVDAARRHAQARRRPVHRHPPSMLPVAVFAGCALTGSAETHWHGA
jgi:hypothetical protein